MSVQRFLKVYVFALFFVSGTILVAQTEVLFSPEDRPAKRLISLIDQSQTKVHAAVYMLTDKRVAESLIRAKNRGVDVQVLVDKISMEGMYGKAPMLREHGVDVYIYASWTKPKRAFFYKADPLMHNKFAIIDEKTWTGSFNWTRSGDHKNQENVVILEEQSVREKYEARFEHLKNLSSQWSLKPEAEATVRVAQDVGGEIHMIKHNSQEIKDVFVEEVARRIAQEIE